MHVNRFLSAIAVLLIFLCADAAAAKARRSAPKKAAAKTTVSSKRSASSKAQTLKRAKSTRGKTSAKRGRRGRTRVAAKPRYKGQTAPTPERYTEIQQALVKRGYNAGEADGQWTAEWQQALKRFQLDNNLTPDGKLGALSLIQLGLGPQRVDIGDVAVRPVTEPPVNP